MKQLLQFYRFLGSIYFAITLIAAVALFVIAGTFIESKTESHRYASHFTYGNPVFIGLLCGFFINILLSALRRWPFQIHHIPFLITHLGLLMILGGTLIKSYTGTQGSMSIIEGSASQALYLPDTYVLQVEKRGMDNLADSQIRHYPLKQTFLGGFQTDLTSSDKASELKIKLAGYSPHSTERLEAWFKGNMGVISGFKPFAVHDWEGSFPESLPVSSRIELGHEPPSQLWDIFAGRTSSTVELAKRAFLQGMEVILTDTFTHEVIFQGSLGEVLSHSIKWSEGKADFELDFSYNPLMGFEDPKLLVVFTPSQSEKQEKVVVPLQGAEALLNINLSTPHLGKGPVTIDLHRTPALVILQDQHNDIHFFAFDAYGQVYAEIFRCGNLNPLIVYDRGFGGYAVQCQLPYVLYPSGRKERERAHLYYLESKLRARQEERGLLSPPLQMLQEACAAADADFPAVAMEFLSSWNETHCWLYPKDILLPSSLMPVMSCLDWERISHKERKACLWIHTLFLEIEKRLAQGQELHSILEKMGWPSLPHDLKLPDENAVVLATLTNQIFMIADQLPDIELPAVLSANEHARLLSAYLRAYSLHLSNIMGSVTAAEMQHRLEVYTASKELDAGFISKRVCLECPITVRQRNEAPQKKLEDNLPKITLEVSKGAKKEWISLTYDRFGQGLKWPIFNGEYLVRFQPIFKTIPYRVRLRHARQINYANSFQAFSYESDLVITDTEQNSSLEKTISMNHVHETWDGYRFYLASIAPPNEGAVKKVQIVVNHDPAKYYMTYPGAIILSLGIILLFWLRPYRKK